MNLESLRCLTRNGRHLVIGFASGIEAEEVPMVNGEQMTLRIPIARTGNPRHRIGVVEHTRPNDAQVRAEAEPQAAPA